MYFTALFLSIERLRKVVDPRSLDLAGTAVDIDHVDMECQQQVIINLEKAIFDWLEKESLPTLDDLIISGRLEYGALFTHKGSFNGKDIRESRWQYIHEEPLTTTPILQAELTSMDGSNLTLEVQVHPRNYISDSAHDELSRAQTLFMIGCLTYVTPPSLRAQAYAIGHMVGQPMSVDYTVDEKTPAYLVFSTKQKADFKEFDYQCNERVNIPGRTPKSRSNLIKINNAEVKIADSSLKLFLRLVVELKKNKGGWVSTQTLLEDNAIVDASIHQPYNNLRTLLCGFLLCKNANKFIENNGEKKYRISTHPDFVTYDKNRLLEHPDVIIREIANKLP